MTTFAITSVKKDLSKTKLSFQEVWKGLGEAQQSSNALLQALKQQKKPLFIKNGNNPIKPKKNKVGMYRRVDNATVNKESEEKMWAQNQLLIMLWLPNTAKLTEQWQQFIKQNEQQINTAFRSLQDLSVRIFDNKLKTANSMKYFLYLHRVFLLVLMSLGIGGVVMANIFDDVPDGSENLHNLPGVNDDSDSTKILGVENDVDSTGTTGVEANDNSETSQSLLAMLDTNLTDGGNPLEFDDDGNLLYDGDDTNLRALFDEYNAEVPDFAKKDLMQLQEALAEQDLTDEQRKMYVLDAFTMHAHCYDLDNRFWRDGDGILTGGTGGDNNFTFNDYATNTKHPKAFRDFMTHYEDGNTPPTTDVIPDEPDNKIATTETTTASTETTDAKTEVADPLASFDYKAQGYTTEQWTDMPPEVKKAVAESAGFDVSQVGGDLDEIIKANNDTIQNLKNKIKQK